MHFQAWWRPILNNLSLEKTRLTSSYKISLCMKAVWVGNLVLVPIMALNCVIILWRSQPFPALDFARQTSFS